MGIFNFYPWENGIKPVFVNAEGFEWYLDKDTTDWATKDTDNGIKGLVGVACFLVKKGDDINRVMINDKQQMLLDDKNLEQMCVKIDLMKIVKNYELHEKK
jgi:hypothetical protein